jgi:hypothetical protein
LEKCRKKKFANCDIQSLELANHLYHSGITDISVVSNKEISHNYVVINKSTYIPEGAIVDPWAGRGLTKLDQKTINKYSHSEDNIEKVSNFMSWIKEEGKKHIIEDLTFSGSKQQENNKNEQGVQIVKKSSEKDRIQPSSPSSGIGR